MINKIGHYSLENPCSIYDEEAMTALELAGRTAGKVNEVVTAFNNLETRTDHHLEEQDIDISNFQETTNQRLEKQEKEIIPDTVQNDVQDHINSGDFDRQISAYMGNLSERVDNLLGSVGEGSTTLDAEVIDIRTDANGVAHANAGTAVRYMTKLLDKRMDYTSIGKNLLPIYWEQGVFDASTMVNYESAVAVRSMGVIACPAESVFLGIPEGLKLNVYSYQYADGAYNYLGFSDWITGEKVYKFLTGATHFKVIAKKTDDTNLVPVDASGIVILDDLEIIQNLNNRVDKLAGLGAKTILSVAKPDHKNSTGVMDCANTKRWFITDVYPSGVLMRSIEFYTSKTRDDVTIEIWEKDGNMLSLAKTVKSYGIAGQVVKANLNHYTVAPSMVSIYTPEACVTIDNNIDGALVVAHGDLTGNEIDLSEATNFVGYLLCASVNFDAYMIPVQCRNVLSVGPGMEYEEIQDALDSIQDDGTYTIEVYPRATPYKRFSMIRRLNEAYPWTSAPVKNISIIGKDKAHCVIRDDSGNYDTPPAELLCNGLIKNLTFIAGGEIVESTVKKGAYAAHIDAEPYNLVGYYMLIEDCVFKSRHAPAVGVGLHLNGHVHFRNCEMVSTANPMVNPHSDYTNIGDYGALFCHTSTVDGTSGQKLTLDNCRIIADLATKSLWVAPGVTSGVGGDGLMFTLEAYNNVCWTHWENAAGVVIDGNLAKGGANSGNNSNALNA